jgi:SAM-dependent methyltransferase
VKRLWRALLRLVPARAGERVFQSWVNVLGTRTGPTEALRNLFALQEHVEREIDHAAMRLDGGVHAKHRLTRYHDFFAERVHPGERVLDVGTGKGELAHDLAARGAEVVALDLNPSYLAFARERYQRPSLTFVEGDALGELPPGRFDVVVLSNVLEHVEPRVELLRRLVGLGASRLLIRVPARDRHWHVPLREELGLGSFSDPTHAVEYDLASFIAELETAGLKAIEVQSRWGELWAEARPR